MELVKHQVGSIVLFILYRMNGLAYKTRLSGSIDDKVNEWKTNSRNKQRMKVKYGVLSLGVDLKLCAKPKLHG